MKFFNLHTHNLTTKPGELALVNQYPLEFEASIPFSSVGIHPWYIKEESVIQELELVDQYSQLPQVAALGECGLDKRIAVPFDLQIRVFEAQLHVAQQIQKPVIIHCVAAFQELIHCISTQGITVPIIIHGFSKNAQLAQQLLQQGYYLSFGKYLFQQPELADVLTTIPEDRFFLETDAMDRSIQEVYAKAADCKKMPIDQIKSSLNCTFAAVFKSV
ncbi:MAG: TatD family hydrolase [Flavobacterium sp.]|nr:TatD family hydrolase [Flavobacterium sp.]